MLRIVDGRTGCLCKINISYKIKCRNNFKPGLLVSENELRISSCLLVSCVRHHYLHFLLTRSNLTWTCHYPSSTYILSILFGLFTSFSLGCFKVFCFFFWGYRREEIKKRSYGAMRQNPRRQNKSALGKPLREKN